MLRGLDMVEGRCHDASETLPRLSGANRRRNGDGGPGGVSLALGRLQEAISIGPTSTDI